MEERYIVSQLGQRNRFCFRLIDMNVLEDRGIILSEMPGLSNNRVLRVMLKLLRHFYSFCQFVLNARHSKQ